MRFSDPWLPLQDHVGRPMHEPEGTQFADLALVEGGLEAEVELLECLQVGEMRQLQPRLKVPPAPTISFGVHHFGEEIGITRCFRRGGFQ